MIQKIKKHLLVISAVLMLSVPTLMPLTVNAANSTCTSTGSNIAAGANAALSSNAINCNASSTGATSSIGALSKNIVNIFSFIVGIAAVIMIIYGGFRYVTSGGDSGRVGSAKNSLIYAIVGLIIVALAQVIVHYVLSAATPS